MKLDIVHSRAIKFYVKNDTIARVEFVGGANFCEKGGEINPIGHFSH